ncbi:MAG: 5-formyltetrahydrofolate cyclo-ligase [Planctomycetota bacterium]|jgi:5-formyltetrahydrofolate cyclo-ligase
MDIKARKKLLRAEIRTRVSGLCLEEIADMSRTITEKLLELPEVAVAKVLFGFMPMPDEVDVTLLMQHFLDVGKRLCVPHTMIKQRYMQPVEVRDLKADFAPGAFDILEPIVREQVDIGEIDLALIPGRAFDRKGNRMGRGLGFYDRFVARESFRATRISAAFDMQMFDKVPVDKYDRPVEIVVTESGVYRFT